MPFGFETVVDFQAAQATLRRRPYGRIEVCDRKQWSIQLRPWPKWISTSEVHGWGSWSHRHVPRDRIRLYYNQPLGHRNFLALKYIVSSRGTTLATLRLAMQLLNEVARIKQSDAIVCEASNPRISDRVMKFFGYERHLNQSRKRHYIRRFYGKYPPPLRPA